MKEIPELNKLVEKYQGKEVVFLAASLDSEKNLQQFLTKQKFNYALIPKNNAAKEAYGVQSYPTHVVIDKNGIIQLEVVGLALGAIQAVELSIQKVL